MSNHALCWAEQFVKFAVLCSKIQMLLFVSVCSVSVQIMVVYVGNCHLTLGEGAVKFLEFLIHAGISLPPPPLPTPWRSGRLLVILNNHDWTILCNPTRLY